MRTRGAVAAVASACAAVLALAACSGAGPSASPSATRPESATPSASAAPSVTPSPEPTLAWGPTVAQWEESLARAAALPLEVAAGQVIVADLYSPDPVAAAQRVRDLHLGGVILMDGAVTTPDELHALTEAVRTTDDRAWPVWISADEEGGVVSRMSAVVGTMPAFMAAGAARDKAAVTRVYEARGSQLRAYGVDVDFAPVADVTIGAADPTIRSRSAGSDPANVAATTNAAVEGFLGAGVVPVIKHFPGHGSVTTDSHQELPVQPASMSELEARDLIPFASAVESGAPAIMVAHIEVPAWGPEPATLQPAAYAYLRDTLGFTGIAVTDALNMGAVVNHHSSGEAAVMALNAGADVLLMPRSTREAIDGIVAAVNGGTLPRVRLDQAVARMTLLLDWVSTRSPSQAPLEDPARALAAAGTTMSAADCATRVVGERATVVANAEGPRAALEQALRDRGVIVGDGGTRIVLMRSGRDAVTSDVVVSMGDPFGLEASTAGAYVATYGSSDASMQALADVLTGATTPGGSWPVEMPGMPYPACG